MRGELLGLTLGNFGGDIGRSLREAFYMFWATLWALVLGFGLSGAVQAFVSREAMQRHLGDHRPASVARASLYGMISSSCSYAASAMARSAFARGADFLASMVFMFASTNLVVELGIVLLVLMGWQFLAAEFIGGAIMILLLVTFGGFWLRGRSVAQARAHVKSKADGGHHHHGAGDAVAQQPGQRRIRTRAGWSDAAGYTMSDLTMLRKELVIGFVIAGFLSVLVPTWVWSDVFIRGHGFWTSLENVVVGPFVALISFVCSIGNVPLAAALWQGGITFGGVVAFVFADLIALPLVLIYRKQYGGRMALRLLAVFWAVMSAAGLATEYLFRGIGWVPAPKQGLVVGDTLQWNYTTVLNIVALAAFAGLYWLYRNRERLGGGVGYAKDPVCGMQVETAHAPASFVHDGHRVYFCSEHCKHRFESHPDRHSVASVSVGTPESHGHRDHHEGHREGSHQEGDKDGAHSDTGVGLETLDPVCGMTVDPLRAPNRAEHQGRIISFCGSACARAFRADPERYLPERATGRSVG